MVITCSAPGCLQKKPEGNEKSNVSTRSQSVQFFKFPLRKADLLSKWLQAINRPDFKPNSGSYLCSRHFKTSDFDLRSASPGTHLKPTAVPSVFNTSSRKKILLTDSEDSDEETKMDEVEYEMIEELEEGGEEFDKGNTVTEEIIQIPQILNNVNDGSVRVLIVDENGEISNSEYIFKEEMNSDTEDGQGDNEMLVETNNLELQETDDNIVVNPGEGDDIAVNEDLVVYDQRTYQLNINQLKEQLINARKKVKVLELKCRRRDKRLTELKNLLKLLVLKRGRGEKNLKQLFESYSKGI